VVKLYYTIGMSPQCVLWIATFVKHFGWKFSHFLFTRQSLTVMKWFFCTFWKKCRREKF
jgi:hypothetical protein